MASDAAIPRAAWVRQHFTEIGSTNDWVRARAREGAAAGLVAVADHQRAGRGRHGRPWIAPPGSSLLVSVLLRPELPLARVPVVTMAAALALADALETVAGLRVGLKWPNDLVVAGRDGAGDRKIAGILAELETTGEVVDAVIVGLGANLVWGELPADLAAIATSVDLEVGRAVDRDAVLDAFLDGLGRHLADPERVPGEYRARLVTLGRRVRVDVDGRDVTGEAVEVDEEGRLVVRPDSGPCVVVPFGDVVHLAPGSGVQGSGVQGSGVQGSGVQGSGVQGSGV